MSPMIAGPRGPRAEGEAHPGVDDRVHDRCLARRRERSSKNFPKPVSVGQGNVDDCKPAQERENDSWKRVAL